MRKYSIVILCNIVGLPIIIILDILQKKYLDAIFHFSIFVNLLIYAKKDSKTKFIDKIIKEAERRVNENIDSKDNEHVLGRFYSNGKIKELKFFIQYLKSLKNNAKNR